ncbi:MAG: hypothetical protein LBB25_02040 [Holosporaceae bacterium]|nr:hypothetical protein [Holosporaceae bacterium]
MRVKILKFEKKLYDGEAEKVVLPAVTGEMCLLPHHISIITLLRKGIIKVFKPNDGPPLMVDVEGGICSFFGDEAVFLIKDSGLCTSVS